MLGEKIGEETGKVTGRRILEGDDYRYLKMEISFEAAGSLLGLQGANMGTYTIFERLPGQLYGEGRGIVMSQDGESAIWSGHGVGRMTGEGMGVAFASSITFQAGAGKLSALNNMLVVVEHTTDKDGNVRSVLYEWKV